MLESLNTFFTNIFSVMRSHETNFRSLIDKSDASQAASESTQQHFHLIVKMMKEINQALLNGGGMAWARSDNWWPGLSVGDHGAGVGKPFLGVEDLPIIESLNAQQKAPH